jgi:hypothetical protein
VVPVNRKRTLDRIRSGRKQRAMCRVLHELAVLLVEVPLELVRVFPQVVQPACLLAKSPRQTRLCSKLSRQPGYVGEVCAERLLFPGDPSAPCVVQRGCPPGSGDGQSTLFFLAVPALRASHFWQP